MKPAIVIEDLSKRYSLKKGGSYLALRDIISDSVASFFKSRKEPASDFWALKDINLEIPQGERIGIIGHNGAGKSTLLKILSRITPPTSGKVTLNGRVASLLEVGTGFHPELTGRENIYLNGSILGIKRSEINKQLGEIIDFSGVEKFIDTPLKNYSSGMQLRLAFSVASHLDAEILLIDEVLAVGDMEFQKKCIGKMEEVSQSNGRTIVFVSHNMAALKQLCCKAIVLEKSQLSFDGPVNSAIDHYTKSVFSKIDRLDYAFFNLINHPNKLNDEGLITAKLYVNNILSEKFIPGADLQIELSYFLKTPLIDPDIGIVIKDGQENSLIGLNNKHLGCKLNLQTNKNGKVIITIPALNIFKPGTYRINLYFGDYYHFYECLYNSIEFQIELEDVYQSGKIMDSTWNQIFIKDLSINVF